MEQQRTLYIRLPQFLVDVLNIRKTSVSACSRHVDVSIESAGNAEALLTYCL